MNSKRLIIGISIIGIIVSAWLIYNELLVTGFCPPYPVLGIPTCYLVIFFFILVLGSQLIVNEKASHLLFYTGSIWGLVTAIWFSSNQILEVAKCPVLFGIPQCYVALVTFALLILLRFSGRKE